MKTSRTLIVPPGGFAGNAQQTSATQLMFAKATGSKGGRTTQRRRRKAKKTATRSRKRKSPRARKARLVKGSAAAKRFMASIRRKRKK